MLRRIIFLLLICVSLNVHAQQWKTYPYHKNNSLLYFPADEGRHPSTSIEWWYTNGFLTGTSGNHYTYMLTYFYNPVLGFNGFRIFNIANETSGQFYPDTKPCNYPLLSQNHLEINAAVYQGITESWTTRLDSNSNLIPFEYAIHAHSSNNDLNVIYIAQKPPLMVADSGFLFQGSASYSYYYSQTLNNVSGIITVNGIADTVSGTAWIDRQYGNYNPNAAEKYEWFSLQLSNGMDLNVWNLFTLQNLIPDTSTFRFCSIYINDSSSASSSAFTLDRQQFVFMPGNTQCYSHQWHFQHDSIDLVITANQTNQEVMLPFRFYEGSVTINGTVAGIPVTGQGFAELLHNYSHPSINITSPQNGQPWNGLQAVTWQLLNKDDGRTIVYDVDVSLNDSLHYLPVAANIADTFYVWNVSSIPSGTSCWLRVTGHSPDSVLTGNDVRTIPVITFIKNDFESAYVKIAPNPFIDFTEIKCTVSLNNATLILLDNSGREMLEQKNLNGKNVKLKLQLAKGIYYFKLIQGNKLFTSGTLIKNQ
jgi:predicted secreted hydrolase